MCPAIPPLSSDLFYVDVLMLALLGGLCCALTFTFLTFSGAGHAMGGGEATQAPDVM
jgi:hypothetical protein